MVRSVGPGASADARGQRSAPLRHTARKLASILGADSSRRRPGAEARGVRLREMKRVTRAVQVEELADLLERPPRATLAFVSGGRIEALPVALRYEQGRYFVGLARGPEPPAGRVKLLVDDGPWYFDLRGIWVRGTLATCKAPAGAPSTSAWYELTPEKTVAWHYGRLREV